MNVQLLLINYTLFSILAPFLKVNSAFICGSLNSQFCSINQYVCSYTSVLITVALWEVLKSSDMSSPHLLIFQIVFIILYPLLFCIYFRISLSILSKKKAYCDFDWNYIEYMGQFGREVIS